ncbi:hypothetical protein P8452_03449 [Trifolium repens]|nr:hypothetical protein P8452_03449 [Trifolium repens]
MLGQKAVIAENVRKTIENLKNEPYGIDRESQRQCQHQERKIHQETKHSNPLGVEYGYRAKEEKTESL